MSVSSQVPLSCLITDDIETQPPLLPCNQSSRYSEDAQQSSCPTPQESEINEDLASTTSTASTDTTTSAAATTTETTSLKESIKKKEIKGKTYDPKPITWSEFVLPPQRQSNHKIVTALTHMAL